MASKIITTAFVQATNKKLTNSGVLINKSGLDSALARPQFQKNYKPTSTVTDLAASLAFGLIKNHPFMDGNKRTAHEVAEEYLKEHGGGSLNKDAQTVCAAHTKVAKGEMDDEQLAAVYKAAVAKK